MRSNKWLIIAVACLALGISRGGWSAGMPAAGQLGIAFDAAECTPENLDPAAFTQWNDGKEAPAGGTEGATQVVWTAKSVPGYKAVIFGDGKAAGARHLRIGFKRAVRAGSVLVRGGGALSVLKADAPYPGNPGDEGQWLPAERIAGGVAGRAEVGADEFGLWVLPADTQTRALRFTHTARVTDKVYAGGLGGVMILSERLVNLAPQATAHAGSNPQKAARLTNEAHEKDRDLWDNEDDTLALPVKEHPAWVMLTWPRAVRLRGLAALWAGFSSAEVEVLKESAQGPALEAEAADWEPLAPWTGVQSQYPRQLGTNWLDFGREVATRAVRLRLTGAIDESVHGQLKGRTKEGRKVWIGELLAVGALGKGELAGAILPQAQAAAAHPPLPVRFTLEKAGLVTLVIEDAAGKRVRNLVSETPFPAGDNVAWWDGLDDLGRDPEAARHGVYAVPGSPVAPGRYTVRGIVHDEFKLRYEFPVYTAGDPAWNTQDNTGAWLANHTPPSAALYVPAGRSPIGQDMVYLGSYVSEGTHGLAWVNLEGKKLGGEIWVGGIWTGAPYLARDDGKDALAGDAAYVASVWSTAKGSTDAELRLTALTAKGDRPVFKMTWLLPPATEKSDQKLAAEISGCAVRDGVIVVALRRRQELLIIDARKGSTVGQYSLDDPRGVAFDAQGRLLALRGRQLMRFGLQKGRLSGAEVVIPSGLEDPWHVLADGEGRFYVSDWGAAHQVKVFKEDGTPLRAIGKPGAPKAGPYDPLHMNHPAGLTLDGRGRLWVTEQDEQPKRVSIWTAEGKLERAFYGPPAYGGGGALDGTRGDLFHYEGMTFRLDWQAGRGELIAVPYRRDDVKMELGFRNAPPETALEHGGRHYLTNCFNNSPTGGTRTAFLFIERDGIYAPVAAMGRAGDWAVLKGAEFSGRWPRGLKPGGDPARNEAVFAWSDQNGDGVAEPDEVEIEAGRCGGVTVMPDLAFVLARLESETVRLAPVRFTAQGVPCYDLTRREILARGVLPPKSSGGDQALVHPDGWSVITLGVGGYSPYSLCGVFRGEARWSYPSPWPGLHASHEAAVPDRPGEVIGSTRLLGGFIRSQAGPLWCINGNMGPMYLFTADGLFVQTLFQDIRQGQPWGMPTARRGMELNQVSPHDENFFPSIGQTADGRVYIQDGGRGSLVRVDGMESLRRLPGSELTIREDDLRAAREWTLQNEAARQQALGRETLRVALKKEPPLVDGKLDDWAEAQWAAIDKRGVRAWFNSNSKPYDVSAAACVAGDRLYAAWRTGDAGLMANSGATPNALFKTGGALDLMLGCDPQAKPERAEPAPGDLRLIVALVNKKPVATLYRAVAPGSAAKDRVPFSSPWRTIFFDRVEDVSGLIQFGASEGDYELSIPLAALGLKVRAGLTLKGDLGVLRGDGFQTVQRVYWSNKATAITADVPSEAMLTPQLWGRWRFE